MSKEGGEGKVGGYAETFEDGDVWAQFRKSVRWDATMLGRSHEGMQVAETEGGERDREVASMYYGRMPLKSHAPRSGHHQDPRMAEWLPPAAHPYPPI